MTEENLPPEELENTALRAQENVDDSKGSTGAADSNSASAAKTVAVNTCFAGYPCSTARLLVLNFVSLGEFSLYYFFRHARAVWGPGKRRTLISIMVAYFIPLFLFKLMCQYEVVAAKQGIKYEFANKRKLAAVFFLLNIVGNISGRNFHSDSMQTLFALLSLIPVIGFQRQVNELNGLMHPGEVVPSPLKPLQWTVHILLTVVFAGLWIWLWFIIRGHL